MAARRGLGAMHAWLALWAKPPGKFRLAAKLACETL